MHEISLLDFSPFVILDSTLTAVPVEKRVAIADAERLKPRDKPPTAEIDGLVLKRPVSRIFEKEVYLADPKLSGVEDQPVVAVGRRHEGNFHLYNYYAPASGTYFRDKAISRAASLRQRAYLAFMLLLTLGIGFLSLGFFQHGLLIGLVWMSPSLVFLSMAKHIWEEHRADRMLAGHVEGRGGFGLPEFAEGSPPPSS